MLTVFLVFESLGDELHETIDNVDIFGIFSQVV